MPTTDIPYYAYYASGIGLGRSYRLLLNTAKNTSDPFAIRVIVKAAYLSSVIVTAY